MSFQPLKDDLAKRVQKAGISEEAEAAMVLERVITVLKRLFGDDADKNMKPLYVKRGVLTVSCLSSVAAQELKLREREIVQEVNDHFGKQVVDRVRFFA